MYCSSCGMAVARGLIYCNHCGAKLGGEGGEAVARSPELRPEFLVASIVMSFVLGLLAIMGLMAVMKSVLAEPFIIAFTLLSFLILLLVEAILIGLLLTRLRRRGAKDEGGNALPKGQSTKELEAAQARSLAEPLPSVTEHTTRALEHAHRERQTR